MIYPQKLTSKKSDMLLKILLLTSIIIAVILVIINNLTTPNIHWAALANLRNCIYMVHSNVFNK